MIKLLEQLERLGAADRKCITGSLLYAAERAFGQEKTVSVAEETEALPEEAGLVQAEAYLAQIRAFLEGQDFLRLGHGINGSNWNSVMMNVRRMRENCKKLGITCFDRWFVGIRDCAQRRNKEGAIQIMTQITAKRVQLRKLFMEAK